MTSVEYLIEQLEAPCKGIPTHIIDKAKEMHKQEIEDAYNNGDNRSAELYYQKTFKKD